MSRDHLCWLPDGRSVSVSDNGAGVMRCRSGVDADVQRFCSFELCLTLELRSCHALYSLFSNENSLHLPLLLPSFSSPDVKVPEKPREKSGLKSLFSMKADVDYASLFEAGQHVKPVAALAEGKSGAAAGARAGVASAGAAAADARDALVERGEKLAQLSDR